jgi:hypothetical protein
MVSTKEVVEGKAVVTAQSDGKGPLRGGERGRARWHGGTYLPSTTALTRWAWWSSSRGFHQHDITGLWVKHHQGWALGACRRPIRLR